MALLAFCLKCSSWRWSQCPSRHQVESLLWKFSSGQPALRAPKPKTSKTITIDGAEDTEPVKVEGKMTLMNGTDLTLTCGSTQWFKEPRVLVSSQGVSTNMLHLTEFFNLLLWCNVILGTVVNPSPH